MKERWARDCSPETRGSHSETCPLAFDLARHLRGEPTATLVTAPHTPARLGDAIVELAADKARRIKLSRVARQLVDTVYQPSRTARRYAALYEILRRQKKDCVTRECNVQ